MVIKNCHKTYFRHLFLLEANVHWYKLVEDEDVLLVRLYYPSQVIYLIHISNLICEWTTSTIRQSFRSTLFFHILFKKCVSYNHGYKLAVPGNWIISIFCGPFHLMENKNISKLYYDRICLVFTVKQKPCHYMNLPTGTVTCNDTPSTKVWLQFYCISSETSKNHK